MFFHDLGPTDAEAAKAEAAAARCGYLVGAAVYGGPPPLGGSSAVADSRSGLSSIDTLRGARCPPPPLSGGAAPVEGAPPRPHSILPVLPSSLVPVGWRYWDDRWVLGAMDIYRETWEDLSQLERDDMRAAAVDAQRRWEFWGDGPNGEHSV